MPIDSQIPLLYPIYDLIYYIKTIKPFSCGPISPQLYPLNTHFDEKATSKIESSLLPPKVMQLANSQAKLQKTIYPTSKCLPLNTLKDSATSTEKNSLLQVETNLSHML